jgi:hypothetical protein
MRGVTVVCLVLMATATRARADDDEPEPLRAEIVLLEGAAGTAAGAVAFLGGYAYGYHTHPPTYEQASSENLPERRGLLFGAASSVLLVPAGVIAVGHGLDQRGSIFGALFGDALGTFTGALVLFNTRSGAGVVLATTLPLLGTVVGYNISRDPPPRSKHAARTSTRWTPTLHVSRELTFVGLSGSL